MWFLSNAPVCLQTSPLHDKKENIFMRRRRRWKREKKKHKARDRLEATGPTKLLAR